MLEKIPFVRTAVPRARFRYAEEVVPEHVMVDWGMRLFTLMNLAWGYIDTVIDLSIAMRITETKRLTRRIRELKREYDRHRFTCIDRSFEQTETERAEQFEEHFDKDFRKLYHAIDFETAKLGLDKDWRAIVIAVQQAMTIMDAVKIFSSQCAAKMRDYGLYRVKEHCMILDEFLALYPLVPLFAGDCYIPNLPARKLTAEILVKRVNQLEVVKSDADHS